MAYDFRVLVGKNVSIHRFDDHCITTDYLDWLRDPDVVRFSNQRFRQHTEQTCRAYLDSFDNSSNLFLAIYLHGKKMVGTMTVYHAVPHSTADIGLMIGDRTQWGNGIGLDAWQTLMDHLLLAGGVRKVTGGTVRCNIGMVRIMECSGMHLEGVRSGQQMIEGEAQDELLFAKFAS